MAIGDNRTPKEDSSVDSSLKAYNNSSTTTSKPQQIPHNDPTLPSSWAILLIVALSIIFLISIGIGGYFLTKRIRDRRKNHGEYKPQQVEHLQAKDLPYITPPNIEGLI